jgi:hypothetical protein
MRGRGMKFGDIPAIRAQVESFSMNSEEMKLAHRLLYKYRGRGNAKEYKRNILAFNGYLREMNSDEDEETLEEEDEEAEVSMCRMLIARLILQFKSLSKTRLVLSRGIILSRPINSTHSRLRRCLISFRLIDRPKRVYQ